MLHNSGMKIGMAVVLFFVFAGWVVCLGALGHVTNECRENTSEWKEGTGDEGILFRWSEPKNEDDEREYTCGACLTCLCGNFLGLFLWTELD